LTVEVAAEVAAEVVVEVVAEAVADWRDYTHPFLFSYI